MDVHVCALFQALCKDGFRHFDIELPNLRDESVDDLLNNTIRISFLLNELDHLSNFLPKLRNRQVSNVLHCVLLHTLFGHDFQ